MMKTIGLICISLITCSFLESKTVHLKTGNLVFHRYQKIEIDEFDYPYIIANVNQKQATLQLEDGSSWIVTSMHEEIISFYKQKNIEIEDLKVTQLFSSWQVGDQLIFHKVVNRDSLLVYNVTRDLLLDARPIKPPIHPKLTIASIKNNRSIYRSREAIRSWKAIITLSDGSVWETGSLSAPLSFWYKGDPIHIVKESWRYYNTHIFIHFIPTRNQVPSNLEFQRIGVWRRR